MTVQTYPLHKNHTGSFRHCWTMSTVVWRPAYVGCRIRVMLSPTCTYQYHSYVSCTGICFKQNEWVWVYTSMLRWNKSSQIVYFVFGSAFSTLSLVLDAENGNLIWLHLGMWTRNPPKIMKIFRLLRAV